MNDTDLAAVVARVRLTLEVEERFRCVDAIFPRVDIAALCDAVERLQGELVAVSDLAKKALVERDTVRQLLADLPEAYARFVETYSHRVYVIDRELQILDMVAADIRLADKCGPTRAALESK